MRTDYQLQLFYINLLVEYDENKRDYELEVFSAV